VRVPCSFDALLGYDLPAVIEISRDGSGARYIALFAIKGDTATVYIKNKQVVIPLETVRELYAGTAAFFTSDTFVNRATLNGEAGLSLEVRKLQDYLRGLSYFGGSPTGWYTPETQAAVLRFQTDYAIQPTGLADGQTKLRLYALAPPDGIPRLKRQ
jgi:hypothetical protein